MCNYKLKENVNLNQLEQFGYELGQDDGCHEAYIKDLGYNDYIAIYENRAIFLDIEDFCGSSWEQFVEKMLEDLIQANLVEKVEE